MSAVGARRRPGHVTAHMPDELADGLGVRLFSLAMLARLEEKRLEGRGGWHDPLQCSEAYLMTLLREQFVHHEVLDPLDIANLAMMVWNRRRAEVGA